MERVEAAAKAASEYCEQNKRTVIAVAAGTAVVAAGAYLYRRHQNYVPRSGPYPPGSLPEGAYDAIIVGAGPSGATCAYFMAKGGAKAALLAKETFPRDKYCADCVVTPAIRILEEMHVLQEFVDNNEAHFADSGGLVSPSGIAYMGASKEKLGEACCCAIKRIHLDTRIARNAQRTGADLREAFEAERASFDAVTGLWTVASSTGASVSGRVLICADGAPSRLATKLGYCTEAPKGVCSRAYVEGGTHNANFDGVCFYPRESMPGYAAIFKHPNDELNFVYYLIPCGKDGYCGGVKESDLPRLHNDAIKNDPFISKALGPNLKIERMRAASLRVGGQGLKTSYDDHLLIIGDAAGHIDPLTGEGIHTAMMGGKAAAQTMLAMMQTGDFSRRSTRQHERKWVKLYGHDFGISRAFANAIYRAPLLMDVVASEIQRQGDTLVAKYGEIMTNMRPKTYFLRPDIAGQLGWAVAREAFQQYVLCKPNQYK